MVYCTQLAVARADTSLVRQSELVPLRDEALALAATGIMQQGRLVMSQTALLRQKNTMVAKVARANSMDLSGHTVVGSSENRTGNQLHCSSTNCPAEAIAYSGGAVWPLDGERRLHAPIT